MEMMKHYINISFLFVIMVPIFILFLTLIQTIGRDISAMMLEANQETTQYDIGPGKKRKYSQRFRQIK